MSVLTLITLVLIGYGVLSSRGYGRALALGGATPAGAAVVVGSTAVPTFYAVALGTAVALALTVLGDPRTPSAPRRRTPPAGSLLLLFFAWSTFVTLVAPVLFDGLAVHTPCPTCARELQAGFLSGSNVAQIIYLALGVSVVFFLARSSRSGPEILGLATGTTTVLSLWRYLHQLVGVPFPEGLFDNSPAFSYIETAPNNVQRFRGILSEPAGLAISSLVTMSYMIPRSLALRGWRRAGALLVAAAAAYLGIISTSTTFVVAGLAVVLIAALTFTFGFIARRTKVSPAVTVAGCGLVIAALWVLPIVITFVESTINEKVGSSSFDDRSSVNRWSYEVLLDTLGFGAGLGSNRASGFLPGLLSTTGIIGTILFAAAVAILIYRASGQYQYRPVIWALVTSLVVKLVSSPDLSDSSGVLWISLGLLSHAAQRADSNVLGEPTTERPRPPETRFTGLR